MTSEGPRSARVPPRADDGVVELLDVMARASSRSSGAASSRASGPGAPFPSLWGLNLRLGSGVHVIQGTRADGLHLLGRVLSGACSPTSGSVRIDGRDPARDAAVRARLGFLGDTGELPYGPTVGAAVRRALAARGGDDTGFDAILDPLGLGALHARSPETLGVSDARGVELALALTTPSPLALVLVEPFLDVAAPTQRILERIELLAFTGTAVILLLDPSSPPPPTASTLRSLDAGRIREVGPRATTASTLVLSFRDGASGEGARELASRVSLLESVRSVTWSATSSGEVTLGSVRVESCAPASVSRALVEAVGVLELDVVSLDVSAVDGPAEAGGR